MAMEEVDVGKGKTGLDLFAKNNNIAQNALAVIKQLNEISRNGITTEEQLHRLRLSNVAELGSLQLEQQQELLAATLAANEAAIDQKLKLQREALQEELETRLAAEGEISEERRKQLQDETDEKIRAAEESAEIEKKIATKKNKKDLEEATEKARKAGDEYVNKLFGKDTPVFNRFANIGQIWNDAKTVTDKNGNLTESIGNSFKAVGAALTKALSDFAQSLDQDIEKIVGVKGAVDTRLQGLNRKTGGFLGIGNSYWDDINSKIVGIAGVSPLIKQEAISERVQAMVKQGIAFNIEQRATLAVMKDKIATTFDATNATLLRLVRIQQQDTTAARLGMESALTAFLNNMYATTEYMEGLATSVKGSLDEAMSLMSGENALSFEYQVQKWLGSLSSVGMSDSAVQGLAGVLGQVAAGKLEGITGGGQGNLVIMAANSAGLSMDSILTNGLTQASTNELLNAMVDYLAKIYNEAGNSKVIQQQIANVYGLSASDLKAAVNLSRSRGIVARDGLDYNSAMSRLNSMANSMYERSSMGELLTNVWDNFQYTMASGIANNPILYGIYKAAGLLDSVAGGIALPDIKVMGSGVNLRTSVADIMRVASLSGSVLSGIAQMAMAGGNGGITGTGILNALGVTNGMSYVSRGTGQGLATTGGASVSESGSMVGNASGEDVQSKTMTDATDSGNQQLASAVDSTNETKLSTVDAHIIDIIDILQTIKDGNATLSVKVDGTVKVNTDFSGGL